MNFEVTTDNVQTCFEYYEEYKENLRTIQYSDASYEEFVEWCEDNLMQCRNCDEIVLKDEQYHLLDDINCDSVCDYCVEELNYYG